MIIGFLTNADPGSQGKTASWMYEDAHEWQPFVSEDNAKLEMGLLKNLEVVDLGKYVVHIKEMK